VTAADRIWTWAWPNGGVFLSKPRRPLDAPEGPTGTEYVRADLYAALVQVNESQATEIARMMRKEAPDAR